MPAPLTGPPLVASWRGMHATASDRMLGGIPPLIAVIALSVGRSLGGDADEWWNGAVVVGLCMPSEKLYWAAVLVNGVPAMAPEMVFADRNGLVAWIQQEAADGGADRVVAAGDFEAGELQLPAPHLRMPAEDIAPDPDQPEFRKRLGGRGAAALAIAGVVGLGALGGWRGWIAWEERKAASEEVVTVAWEQPLEQIANACAAELRKYWPRPPGWVYESSGCVAPGLAAGGVPAPSSMDPRGAAEGAAYRSYRLAANHDGTLARAVAKLLYAEWDGDADVSTGRILLRRSFPLQRIRAGAGRPRSGRLSAEIESHFLGVADEVRAEGRSVSVTSRAAIPTLLLRLAELDRHRPLSLKRATSENGLSRLEIVDREIIMLPAPPGG
ncbi:MAG: hypothetical protein OYG32_18195 [Rhodospirillaceae bacterium]|nr:hypothetical protein [Rhodospirillaceae bacterium]